MIVLDTNIVSEVMKPYPTESVIAWMDGQASEGLFLSTVTVAEIRFGLGVLPEGRRRQELEDRFDLFLARGFEQRILAFDRPAAHSYAELMARRRQLGRPMSVLDGQIAAIAHAHRCGLATRNVRHFQDCGLDVVNPFER